MDGLFSTNPGGAEQATEGATEGTLWDLCSPKTNAPGPLA